MTLAPDLSGGRSPSSAGLALSRTPRVGEVDVAVLDECDLVLHGVSAMVGPFVRAVRGVRSDGDVGSPAADVTLWDPVPGGVLDRHQLRKVLGDARHGRVLLYSLHPPQGLIKELVALGCAGFVDKAATAEDVVDAVLAAVPAEVEAPARPLYEADLPARAGKAHGLSPRETEIVSLIVRGLSNEDISARTDLSVNTVKSYIRSAYHKLDISKRAEAVRWGMERGLDLVDGPASAPPAVQAGQPT